MNRIVSENLRDVTPERLPPAARQGPARVLFIHINLLGFKTHARNIKHYTALRDDIDATHIDLVRPMWIKVLNKQARFGERWDLRHWRSTLLWRPVIRKWLTGPLHLKHFDVVHFLTPTFGWGMAKLKQAGLTGATRMAVNLDCDAAQFHREFGWSWLGQRPVFRAEKQIFDASDRVFTFSEWSAASVRADYGIAVDKVRVAPGSLLLNEHPCAPHLPHEDRMPRLVFIGNDWNRKGGPLLLDLFRQHFSTRAELHIISTAVASGPAIPNVIWHGAVPHDRLIKEVLPTMDLMVMPTNCDMSPWVLLEAAAAGLSIVSTRMAAIPEMVAEGQTGFLCDKGDAAGFARAVERLISDPALRQQMGRAARRHIETHYNADVHYNRMIDELVAL